MLKSPIPLAKSKAIASCLCTTRTGITRVVHKQEEEHENKGITAYNTQTKKGGHKSCSFAKNLAQLIQRKFAPPLPRKKSNR